jgi:asparagine synthase (glutamine-hydrolysing)
MCGIAGYVEGTASDSSAIRAMTRAIRKRGPDDEGFFEAGAAHLGFRRLSVIDLEGGAQPIFNEDRSLVLVFNGEIYNFQELRKELIAAGHRFRSQGDGEVLIHGYEQWGTGLLDRLTGMFAFAIWDIKNQRLFLARDHLGVKPLYYYWDGSLFAFGSELKALLPHPGVRREVDLDAIAVYLECQYIPAPRSIYTHIRKLRPGHYLSFKEKAVTETSYWLPDYSSKPVLATDEAVKLLDQKLRDSVTSMLVSDVPLGAFISGGIDSSLIASVMTDCAGKPVDTFNLGFSDDAAHSEHLEAEVVARHIGSRHHVLMIGAQSVVDTFEDWTSVFDEPFGDQAALPTLMLAQFARRDVTVVMTGEGADEVFAGYGNYKKRWREEQLVTLLAHKGSPLPWMIRHLPAAFRKDRVLKAVTKPRSERYVTIPNVFDEALREDLLTKSFLDRVSDYASRYAGRYFDECNSESYFDKIMYVDSRMWLPDDLLTKVDRATMAYSLEARVPYLDHHLFEFAARLEPGLKHHGSETKYVLKKVAERYLPKQIIYRSKQGFHLPLRSWLSKELAYYLDDYLSESSVRRRNIFRVETIRRLVDQHRTGMKDHAIKLWNLIVLEKWMRAYEPDFSVQ